jgi:putative FmdB family regulatory protein
MPLFNYQCQSCDLIVEKFVHKIDSDVEITCEECDGVDFEKIVGLAHNRTWLNAKDNFNKRISPDAERIRKNMSQGNDNDFLDIAGD